MGTRVHRFILVAALLASAVFPALAQPAPQARSTPARPTAKPSSPTSRARASKLISLADVATRLGLKVGAVQPGAKITLSDATRSIVFEGGSRETLINGLRVFLGNTVVVKNGVFSVTTLDYEVCLVPLLKPAATPRRPNRPKVIAIDAGHGGVDQGTENRRLQMKEKTYTLDVAHRLKAILEPQGYKVVLTRSTDVTMDKQKSVSVAKKAAADLFVSIHFNALPDDQKTRGTEVFTFAPQYQRSTNSWSPFESDDTEIEAAPGNHFDAWNSMLAHSIHRELLSKLKTFDRGKKIAHLGVLRGLECPGVLVESGFLSNDEEARRIGTAEHRQDIALALAAGIHSYAKQIDAMASK
jgi:N-acetylmuramoyl-L-alanine amidase